MIAEALVFTSEALPLLGPDHGETVGRMNDVLARLPKGHVGGLRPTAWITSLQANVAPVQSMG